MAEYIERTEEIMLAMNAGARAIENTQRYHGDIYIKDVFSDNQRGIPYLRAAKVLREASDDPGADVAPVVRCKDCKHEFGGSCILCGFQSRKPDDFCSYGERKDKADAEG